MVKKQAQTPKKKPQKQALKAKGKAKPSKRSTKPKKQSRVVRLLNGRLGVMLIGATLIFCVLMLAALLPFRWLLAQTQSATEYVPTLIAAPIPVIEAVVSTPTRTPSEDESSAESEAGTSGGEEALASLVLRPDIEPTPDGTFREVRVPILMYHYVSTPPEDADVYRLDLSVTPEQFEDQLAWLVENDYTSITFYDLIAWMADGTELPDKPVMLTFDDGYRDNYEEAFPLLEEYGQVGTFFILTGVSEQGHPEYMTWAMLRQMAEAGQQIEVHAHDHLDLAGRDPAFLQLQVADSAAILEERLGYQPRFLSYPGGSYDDDTIDAVRDAGYWLAVTTRFGCLHATGGEYELARIRVRGEYGLGAFADLVESAFTNEDYCYGWVG